MARGRKRKAGRRLPCGKRPREETQREAMSTVLDARRRHFGVTASQAKDERLGTALGRLSFTGRIGAEQFAAGQLYGEIMARNRAVTGTHLPHPSIRVETVTTWSAETDGETLRLDGVVIPGVRHLSVMIGSGQLVVAV